MDTENDAFNSALNPDHARKIAAILSIQPDDSQPLMQFSAEQREAYEWAIQWLHDFNLGRRPKPGFSDEVLGRLTGYHETQMNHHYRWTKAFTAAAKPSADPLDEWSQRMLAGMKRMDTDPEFRAFIQKRIT